MGRWMSIKHKKASADARKGVALAKYSHEIIMATKVGGPDPAANFRLRTAIERAKAGGLPNSKIENAITKGQGSTDVDTLESLTYEGYGPGGVAIFIEAATDNRNRTAGDIRSYFNKYEGNLGQDGSVAFLFEHRGLIRVVRTEALSEELELALMEAAIEAGALDVQEPCEQTDEHWEIYTTPEGMNAVCQALGQAGVSIASAEWTRVALTQVDVADETLAKPLLKLLEALEQQDDVQAVYANVRWSEALQASLMS